MKQDKFVVKFYRIFSGNKVTNSAGELSYYLLFAFFPVVMVVYAALSLVGKANPDIFSRFARVLPHSVSLIIATFIEDISSNSSNISFLITGTVLTFFSVSKFTHSAKNKVRAIYGNTQKTSFLHEWFISGIFSVLLLSLFFITLLFMILGEQIIMLIENVILRTPFDFTLINIFRYLLTLFFLIFVIYLFYFIIPNVKQVATDVIFGTIFTAVGWLIVSAGFTFYMNNFERFSLVYGSIGALIILLLWFYATNLLLLSGAVINSIIYNKRIGKTKKRKDNLNV